MKMRNAIKIFWQLPQTLAGYIVKKICKATVYTTYNDAVVYSWKYDSGLSLGSFIFVPFAATRCMSYHVQQYIKHEYGHTMQSKLLGWTYLIFIGLPSLVWAGCFKRYRKKTGKSHYDFYTEKWADKLGGVDKRNF